MDKSLDCMNNQRVFFIGVGFHEYDNYIIKHLQKKYEVCYMCSSKFYYMHPYISSLSQKYPRFIPNGNHRFTNEYIEKTRGYDFDIIFVIKGSNLTDKHLETLKRYHPRAKWVLYLWDEWTIMQNRDVLKKHFPNIFSFDSEDCKKYGFKFRPLFYLENNQTQEKVYDISFVGVEHSNRLKMLIEMKKMCLDNKLSYYFVIIIGLFSVVKLFFSNLSCLLNNGDIIKRKGIPYAEFLKVTRLSKVVIDIHQKRQSGLTMRTIEALASGTKVITTNKYIREYSNIPKDMYYVWDTNKCEEILDFIKKPASKYTIDSYFSIEFFLQEILG